MGVFGDRSAGDVVEAYASYSSGAYSPAGWANTPNWNDAAIVLRASAGFEVAGRLYVPAADWKSMTPLFFRVPATSADGKAREAFFEAKRQHYQPPRD